LGGDFDYCMGVEFLCSCSGQDHLMGFNSPKGYWLLVVVINIGLIFVGLYFVVIEFVVLNMQQQIQNLHIFIAMATNSIIKLLLIILNEKLDN
jgi:hypothetical protein